MRPKTVEAVKVVLTRNFKQKTTAGYCLAVLGTRPEDAEETDEVSLKNAQVVEALGDPLTRQFKSFGCGLVIVGELTSKKPEDKAGARRIKWEGFGFAYSDTPGKFLAATRLVATNGLILVWD